MQLNLKCDHVPELFASSTNQVPSPEDSNENLTLNGQSDLNWQNHQLDLQCWYSDQQDTHVWISRVVEAYLCHHLLSVSLARL